MSALLVSAVLKRGVREDLEAKLASRVLEAVTPFGPALQDALCRACCDEDGRVCFEIPLGEPPPLQAEREYTLDWYFQDIQFRQVEPGAGWAALEGKPRLYPTIPG